MALSAKSNIVNCGNNPSSDGSVPFNCCDVQTMDVTSVALSSHVTPDQSHSQGDSSRCECQIECDHGVTLLECLVTGCVVITIHSEDFIIQAMALPVETGLIFEGQYLHQTLDKFRVGRKCMPARSPTDSLSVCRHYYEWHRASPASKSEVSEAGTTANRARYYSIRLLARPAGRFAEMPIVSTRHQQSIL